MRPRRAHFRTSAVLAVVSALGVGTVAYAPASADNATSASTTTASVDYSNLPPVTLDGINERTQISIMHLGTGITVGTENQDEPRPGLSQNKLYIADWVLRNGTESEKKDSIKMLKNSHDITAQTLFRKYGKKTISETATRYNLEDTYASSRWGSAPTSTADLVKFIHTKLEEDPNDPLLRALRTTTSVAADGYPQDFGTANISGVKGTKWGWTDDRSSGHSSTSFSDDFIISVHTYGSLSAHNADVAQAIKSTKSHSGSMSLDCSQETDDGTGTQILVESVPLPGLPALYRC